MEQFQSTVMFDVIHAAASVQMRRADGRFVAHQKLSLVLRSERGTQIKLSSGEALDTFDIDFSLSTQWSAPQDLDLSADAAGYLFHKGSDSSGGRPRIHGAGIWPFDTFPTLLFLPDLKKGITLTLGNVPISLDSHESFNWKSGREHMIMIAGMGISVVTDLAEIVG